MKNTIEIIRDNGGSVTIQDTETKTAIYYQDENQAIEDVKLLLSREELNIESWDGKDPESYITDELYIEYASSGGYALIDAVDFVKL